MKSRAQMLLGMIACNDLHGLCEWLGEYANPDWMDLMTGSGEVGGTAVMPISVVRLAHFDMDWETVMFVQTWDASTAENNRTWRYAVLHNSVYNDWVPEPIYGWGSDRPSFTEVGEVIDTFYQNRR